MDGDHQRRVVRELVDDLGVRLEPDALGADLSPAERQLTMIVRALSFEPSVLVLDEPTSSLGQSETEHLLALVRRLAAKGLGIIYISHYLEEVLEDRRSRHGPQGWPLGRDAAGGGVTPDGLVRLMVGRDASAFFVKETVEIGEVRLRAEDLTGPASRAGLLRGPQRRGARLRRTRRRRTDRADGAASSASAGAPAISSSTADRDRAAHTTPSRRASPS